MLHLMPVYLFTFHAYGSWMPDRQQGYVHRTEGLKPTDAAMAERYRSRQAYPVVVFTTGHQRLALSVMQQSAEQLALELHGFASDPSHLHMLVGWRHERSWHSIRKSLKQSITRGLNAEFGRRRWLAAKGSRKRVKDRAHFEYLCVSYLPEHRGVVWVRSTQ